MSEAGETNPIMLYDGVCGLCNRLVQFFLKHDKRGRLRFASLQSEFAATVLNRHGIDSNDLDTVQLVINYARPDERVLNRSDAILSASAELGMPWTGLATIARIIPRPVRDVAYGFVARNRYRVFGKSETCMLPDPNQQHRFLDHSAY